MRLLLSDPLAQLRLYAGYAAMVGNDGRLNPQIVREIGRRLDEAKQRPAQIQLVLDLNNVTRVRQPIPSSTRAQFSLPTPAPPDWFMLLLACVAQKGRVEELLGDVEEDYRTMIVRFGPRRARWWYRIYVVKDLIAPMLPGVVARLWVFHKLFGL
jgi:hypothetical protein